MNYFNYFTEIEEHFQRKRGAQVFVSPVDWALIAAWRDAGIPLAAVLTGIDAAFEKFDSGRRRDTSRRRSLVYCAAAVMEAAEAAAAAGVGAAAAPSPPAPEDDAFSPDRVRVHVQAGAQALRNGPVPVPDVGAKLEELLAAPELPRLDELDRVLTVLDDKIFVALQAATPVDAMVAVRRELETELAPYRRSMRAEQITMIERQFLQRRLLERAGLRRLSLFYMHG